MRESRAASRPISRPCASTPDERGLREHGSAHQSRNPPSRVPASCVLSVLGHRARVWWPTWEPEKVGLGLGTGCSAEGPIGSTGRPRTVPMGKRLVHIMRSGSQRGPLRKYASASPRQVGAYTRPLRKYASASPWQVRPLTLDRPRRRAGPRAVGAHKGKPCASTQVHPNGELGRTPDPLRKYASASPWQVRPPASASPGVRTGSWAWRPGLEWRRPAGATPMGKYASAYPGGSDGLVGWRPRLEWRRPAARRRCASTQVRPHGKLVPAVDRGARLAVTLARRGTGHTVGGPTPRFTCNGVPGRPAAGCDGSRGRTGAAVQPRGGSLARTLVP